METAGPPLRELPVHGKGKIYKSPRESKNRTPQGERRCARKEKSPLLEDYNTIIALSTLTEKIPWGVQTEKKK